MFRKTLLVLTSVLMVAAIANADTTIPGGSVSGSWTREAGPYLINGDITVEAGQRLDIEPSVYVVFQGPYKMTVNGVLSAIGSSGSLIYFSAQNPAEGWRGLRFKDTPDPENRLSWCDISYCYKIEYPGAPLEDLDGGAIYLDSSDVLIERCIFRWNSGKSVGAIAGIESPVEIINCIFWGNKSTSSEGVACILIDNLSCSVPKITNCIFWYNNYSYASANNIGGTCEVTYCDVEDGFVGDGNIDADPMFVNTAWKDFHLLEGSPCIDAGDLSSPLDPDGTRADMGVYYFDQDPTGVEPNAKDMIFTYALHPACPNPFNPSTTLSYTLPAASHVALTVYDINGCQVCTLVDGWREIGHHQVQFDASGLASGVYIYKLETTENSAIGKMVLIK